MPTKFRTINLIFFKLSHVQAAITHKIKKKIYLGIYKATSLKYSMTWTELKLYHTHLSITRPQWVKDL